MTHISENQSEVVQKPTSDERSRIFGLLARPWTIVVVASFIIFLPQQISGWVSKIL